MIMHSTGPPHAQVGRAIPRGATKGCTVVRGLKCVSSMKHVRRVSVCSVFYGPPGEVCVEDLGNVKHPAHIRHLAGVPGRNVRIEDLGIIKHPAHIFHPAGVPGRNVRIEGMILRKYAAHVGHLAGVPRGKVSALKA